MESTAKTTTYKIEGMTCNHCVANVDKSLKALEEIQDVTVDLQKNEVTVKGNVDAEKIKKIVENIGYSFKGEK